MCIDIKQYSILQLVQNAPKKLTGTANNYGFFGKHCAKIVHIYLKNPSYMLVFPIFMENKLYFEVKP